MLFLLQDGKSKKQPAGTASKLALPKRVKTEAPDASESGTARPQKKRRVSTDGDTRPSKKGAEKGSEKGAEKGAGAAEGAEVKAGARVGSLIGRKRRERKGKSAKR